MGPAHATQSDILITVTQIDFCIEFLSPFLIKTEHSGTLFAAAGCSFLPPHPMDSVAHLSELGIRSQVSHYLWRRNCCHKCLRDTYDVVTRLVTPGAHICHVSRRAQSGYKGWFLISMIIILFNSGNFFSIIRGTSFRTNLSGRHLSSVHQCLPGSGLGIFVGAIINGCNNSLRAGGVGRLHQTLSFLQTIDIIFDDFQWY